MHRRAVLGGVAAILATPRRGHAQIAGRIARVSIYVREPSWRGAVTGVLRERGWIEGRTIAFTAHPEEGAEDHIAEHLAAGTPDVMVLGGPIRLRAAIRVTTTVPIIALDLESDPSPVASSRRWPGRAATSAASGWTCPRSPASRSSSCARSCRR